MIPRTFEMEHSYGPYPDPERSFRSTDDTDLAEYTEISLAGLAALGAILILVGVSMTPTSSVIGGGVAFFGFLLMITAGAARKWELEGDIDYEPEYDYPQEPDLYTEDEINRFREEDRKREIEEIVKAVKSTIRVRCRYCGTLNDEKSNKCESCGGAL